MGELFIKSLDGTWYKITDIRELPTLTFVHKRKRPKIYKKYLKPITRTFEFSFKVGE